MRKYRKIVQSEALLTMRKIAHHVTLSLLIIIILLLQLVSQPRTINQPITMVSQLLFVTALYAASPPLLSHIPINV